ncbi:MULTISPECIES: amidohydrolase family protein [Pseudomonas]|uniref:Amidohydrolase family protein n=1 Tax=Pseudomonas quercus TaxID=2722792 RepID=A0ABX0YFT7_9PSED|nr:MULTISPECIES: amidohydrolase family protein [Pseudomonas]MBF7142523.1 amidohydrolase family protein [Pseudomonas sp. LY10J]NJP01061.1 amidohydrolase family protein [Pseudomonas quercus]
MLFDAHCHIIDPRFPLVPNQGYLPPAFDVGAYLAQATPLGVTGGAVVSGSFQAFDQAYLIDALKRLGKGFVGVTQVEATVTDQALADLHTHGIRALRFNLRRGGSEPLGQLERMAQRVHALFGWHVELYVDSRDLAGLTPRLLRLPAVSIDHLGLSGEGLPALQRLVEQGVRVKACGFGRVDFAVGPALQQLDAANPHALMFGSDLPSTRAPRPFQAADITLIKDALGEARAQAVLWRNAQAFYRCGHP